jgi:hypothetical protein
MSENDRTIANPAGAEEHDPRLERLYREAERSIPPAHLDAAILAAARRDVGARPLPLTSAARRWRVPVAIAAVVVLSVSLVTLVREEGGEELVQVAPGPAVAPKPPGSPTPPAPASAQPDAEKRSVSAAPALRRAAPPAPRDDERPAARGELGAMSDSVRRDAAAGPEAGAGTALVPDPPATPAPQAFPAPRRVEETAQAERKAGSEDAGAPAVARESPKALARSSPSTVAAADPAPPWRGYEKEPPQKWLERITELRRQGETARASEMVAEFKRRFPDHALPADLDRP